LPAKDSSAQSIDAPPTEGLCQLYSRSSFLHSPVIASIQAVSDLHDWTEPIRSFQDMYSQHLSESSIVSGMSAMSVVPNTELILPVGASDEATLFYHQLIGLIRFSMHVNASHINNVFANLQMVGVTFSCLSRGTWGEISDVTVLELVMAQYVYSLCILTNGVPTCSTLLPRHHIAPRSPNYMKKLFPNKGKDLFKTMKFNYQLAVSISPILLLLPKKLTSKKIRQDYLIYVREPPNSVYRYKALCAFRWHMSSATAGREPFSKSKQRSGEWS
jgi:hypothetical protein